jgi:hypothetical protein
MSMPFHQHRFGLRTRWFAVLVLLLLPLLAPGITAGAQESDSVTVGASTVSYTSDWEIFDHSTTAVVLEHREAPFAVFSYMEVPAGPAPTSDNAALIEAVLAEQDALEATEVWQAGRLADGTLWQVRSVTLPRGQFVLVVTGNTEQVPGAGVVTSLLTEPTHVSAGYTAASQGITVNGQPHAIAGIPLEVLAEVLWDATSEGTPATAPREPTAAGDTPMPESASWVPEPGEGLLHWYFNDATGQLIGTSIENFTSEERARRGYEEVVADFMGDEAGVTTRRFPQEGADLRAWGADVDEGFLAIVTAGGQDTLFAVFRTNTVVYSIFVPLTGVEMEEATEFIYYELRGEGRDHLPDGFEWGMTT